MSLVGINIDPERLPRVADSSRAARGMERLTSAAETASPDLAAWIEGIAGDVDGGQLLRAVFACSPFLSHCAASEPAVLRQVIMDSPDAAIAGIMANVAALKKEGLERTAIARGLRIAKRQMALATAFADVAGIWSLQQVTSTLSNFADSALSTAATHLLRERSSAGAFDLPFPDDPERGSGLVIIGMGKLGAGELNYSSDIDLIILYDAEVVRTDDTDELAGHFVRLARDMVHLMDERTADGYVFRTDLRLRPDPGSTPLALSVLAAVIYYESLGQNWERAAMIKARPVAGDLAAGKAVIDMLRPFVWRRNLDFAAIQDVHSIKRQINAHRGGSQIAVNGHNIKLGRGGIREIEFFAQTQQLIWGGREPLVRAPATESALHALTDLGPVKPEERDEMIGAYRFLRQLEHRLQMVNDEQTQTLPRDDAEMAEIAAFMGYDDLPSFVDDLLGHLRRVETHYANLFEEAPGLGEAESDGNLVFTGGEIDPDTLNTLEKMGFGNPTAVDAAVRGWHHGRYRATRSTRSREILTEIMPVLLSALARTAEPDDAFLRFNEFLSRLPGGVQLFSMFHSHPELLDLVAEIMGQAPRLAEHLARRPHLLDSVLTADFFEPLPGRKELVAELGGHLARSDSFEAVLDACRRWNNDRRFQVGVQRLRGILPARDIADSLSAVADVALEQLLPQVETDFQRQHGRIAGSELAIVALGKLGSAELTPTSDLDLIFVYTLPNGADASDGQRSLSPTHYFARLGQRLISALTAQTSEGRLYEVDLRLRPSGHAGPLATSLDAWRKYQSESAWTWEHMALTRARVVAGPPNLRGHIEEMIHHILTRPRDSAKLLLDVDDMRERILKEHGTSVIWDIKHVRGGLIDVEFIAQYVQLRHGSKAPEILHTSTREALRRAGEIGSLGVSDSAILCDALDLWHGLQGLLRLFMDRPPSTESEEAFPEKLRDDLTRCADAADFEDLSSRMATARQAVTDIFDRLIAGPAQEIRLRENAESENTIKEDTT